MKFNAEIAPQRWLRWSCFCVLALSACGAHDVINGENQTSFSRSLTEIAEGLPDGERKLFLEHVEVIASSQGDYSLDKASIQTLALLNGRTRQQVRKASELILLGQKRDAATFQLNAVEKEFKELTERSQYLVEQQQTAARYSRQLANVVANIVNAEERPNGGSRNNLVLDIAVKNNNESYVDITALELTVNSGVGGSQRYGTMGSLGIGMSCLLGTRVSARSSATVRCQMYLPFAVDAHYEVKILEVLSEGLPSPWLIQPSEKMSRQIAENSTLLAGNLQKKERLMQAISDLEKQLAIL